MTIDRDDLLNSIMASLDRIDNIRSGELPDIDLYMDQVTNFLESRLKQSSRHPEEDKILTKTMINNYAKSNLLPPPDKKKYNKEQIVLLILIYYSKGLLSMQDIEAMLNPITERYYRSDGEINLCTVYDELFSAEKERKEEIKEDIKRKFDLASQTFNDVPEEDREVLQNFALIFMLGYDIYTKKLLVEKLLDEMAEAANVAEPDKKKNSKKK